MLAWVDAPIGEGREGKGARRRDGGGLCRCRRLVMYGGTKRSEGNKMKMVTRHLKTPQLKLMLGYQNSPKMGV